MTPRIQFWHCTLTILITETHNFWSPSFLVILASKGEKLLFQKRVTWSYTKFEAHFTFFLFYTGSIADKMKLLKHRKLDKIIFQDPENSIDNFRVSDLIDEISIWGCKLDFGPTTTLWKSVKIQKMSCLVCGFFCILVPCANILLIPRPSDSW